MSKKIYRNGKLVLPKLIAGGCSFTFGHELSDDNEGRTPSKKSWAHGLKNAEQEYLCTAKGGAGNSGAGKSGAGKSGAARSHRPLHPDDARWAWV